MKKIGMDLGKRQSDVCVIDEKGEVVERYRMKTKRSSMSARLANVPACEIAIESCRDSGWVYDHLRGLGHIVRVIDTTRARTIGVGAGRRKTDKRDAEALARCLISGVVPEAHVIDRQTRELRDLLAARDRLVRTRTSLITQIRGMLQGRGIDVPRLEPKTFHKKLGQSAIDEVRATHIQSLFAVLECIAQQLKCLEIEMENTAERYEQYDRLCSIPGVKLVVALSVIAALDEAGRFDNPHQVEAYLGLVPSEYSTGGKRRVGSITRCGNSMARRMLVQAALVMMMSRGAQGDPLVVWAKQVEKRRGHKKATVALARRLAGVMWAMWVDGTCYDPKGLARESFEGLSRKARRALVEARCMKQIEMVAHAQ